MARLAARVGQYLLVLLVAASVNFALPRLAPGDPIDFLYDTAGGGLTAEQAAEIRAQYGLDEPVLEQYTSHLAALGRGDLGTSIEHNRPVADVLLEHLPWTLLLVAAATIVATLLAVAGGAIAAVRRGRRDEVPTLVGVLVLDAMPGFWVAMVLVAVFSVQLGWFPSFGAVPIGAEVTGLAWVGQVAHRLVLPVAALVLATFGGTFLLTRAATSSALDQGYVLMAEAKGASRPRVLVRHALRNALLPVSTTVSLRVAVLLSGAVVIETVFAYPGLGRLLYDATLARDYPLLQGGFLLVTVGVILANLVADLLYLVLDPRVRRPVVATS